MLRKFFSALSRKKRNDSSEESKLARVLNLFDLTALGVGSTLGLGVYVLAGSVAFNEAGPSVVISFLIAAIASAFAGLCYAEFAARVPKAGSAYVYSYVSVGEFIAFTIGWNLILEYVIGTSSVARGLSGYLDALIDNKMSAFWRDLMPINIGFLAEYPDFFSFVIVMVLSFLLASGVKESTFLNNVFTAVNLTTVIIMLIAGGMNADPKNWAIAKEDIPEDKRGGEGGFMPYGIAGIMAGAAKCFYGFVGFDCVATTGEEAKNPKRNIPLAIVISLIIIFLAYFGISTVLTMMLPYYMQDPDAPFPAAFEAVGWTTVKWIVSIGAIFALCTSLLGAMFPLPRVLYAMSNDGILYKFMKTVHPKTKTPLIATILSGFLAAIMATIFNLHQLIDMMSIGTLLAYTIVAICVLVLHYEIPPEQTNQNNDNRFTMNEAFSQIANIKFINEPNMMTSNIVKICVSIFCILSVALCGLLKFEFTITIIVLASIVGAGLLLVILVISRQPKDKLTELTFKVPLVPVLPCLSILINLYLMFQLDKNTWVRFAVWVAIGYFIYFTYGIRKSTEGRLIKENKEMEYKKEQHIKVQPAKIETISDRNLNSRF